MADVFISYSKSARRETEALADFLGGEGYSVWWDAALVSGESFRSVILKELDAAKAVIVIWTPASIESAWVISEAERAADDGKLITLRTPDIPLQRIPMPFGVRHTELVDNRAAVLAAVRSCGARARKPAAGVPPPVSAAAMESGSSAGGSPASWGDLGQAAGWIVAVAAALVGGIVLINGWSGSDPKERLRGFSDSKAFPGSSPEAGSVREGVEAEWGRAAPGMDAVPSPSAGGGPTN